MVWAGAEGCARDLGRKRQWDAWARECSDLEYLSIASWRLVAITLPENIQNLLGDELAKALRTPVQNQ